MQEPEDNTLLQAYRERSSETAFAELVARHLNKVFAVALRKTGDVHKAEEISQAVFVILARKACSLGPGVILSGWLYQTARLTAVTYLRSEIRRAHREQEAYMQSTLVGQTSEGWRHIEPLLDDAMAVLSELDRQAIILRFFDGRSMQEVGAALGATEETARKRVSRAIERLRKYFARRGVVIPAAALTAAVSTHAASAAPPTLAGTIATAALTKGAVMGSTTALANSALKLMAWAKLKAAIAPALALLFVASTATWIVRATLYPDPEQPAFVVSAPDPGLGTVGGLPRRAGLMARWDGQGLDLAGTHNAQLVGGATNSPGRVGQAFQLDGRTAHARVADSADFHLTKSLSLEAWIYPTRVGDGVNHAILDKWDAVVGFDQRSYGWGFYGDGRLGWGGSADGLNLTGNVYANAAIPSNQWTFLAATYDGAKLKIYVNGLLDNAADYSGEFFHGTNELGIGGEVGGSSNDYVNGPFAGMIDALSLYNRALTAGEIKADFEASQRGK